jgi:signal transduction histidine kinase
MSDLAYTTSARWYRSLYFRIGFTFAAFVLGLLLLQGFVLRVVLRPPLRGSPNTVVALVSADLTAALTENRALDVDAYLKRQYNRSQPIYAVMKSGEIASNRSAPLADDLRRYVEDLLAGQTGSVRVERTERRAFVTAPIQIDNTLSGIIVLPPATPPGFAVREIERLTSLPGTVLLIVMSTVAAAFIFEPARRRLKGLREAALRLGAGDLSARAPASGGDEVAELAVTFNRMAEDLSARDAALRQSDRLRRQMLADVSHELKTPLTAMRGYVETLHRHDLVLDATTRARYLDTLERETRRLDRIVKDLLDLARLENGVSALDSRVFASKRLFDLVVQRHQPEIDIRRLAIDVRVEDDADQIVADPDRIEQVIENLFSNALRHVPDGGAIALGAALDADAYVLTVTDSGSGISAQHLPWVFERFYKVDGSRSSGDGSGLGLSISKAIVERHGGRIDVTSRPGLTVFTIHLPFEAAGEAAAHAASTNL